MIYLQGDGGGLKRLSNRAEYSPAGEYGEVALSESPERVVVVLVRGAGAPAQLSPSW